MFDCFKLRKRVATLERKAADMAQTQAELAQELTAVSGTIAAIDQQVTKVQGETNALKTEVTRLNDLIQQGGPITQELQNAAAGVVAKVGGLGTSVQTLDDIVPDTTPPSP